jgi:hypothetical protein
LRFSARPLFWPCSARYARPAAEASATASRGHPAGPREPAPRSGRRGAEGGLRDGTNIGR